MDDRIAVVYFDFNHTFRLSYFRKNSWMYKNLYRTRSHDIRTSESPRPFLSRWRDWCVASSAGSFFCARSFLFFSLCSFFLCKNSWSKKMIKTMIPDHRHINEIMKRRLSLNINSYLYSPHLELIIWSCLFEALIYNMFEGEGKIQLFSYYFVFYNLRNRFSYSFMIWQLELERR